MVQKIKYILHLCMACFVLLSSVGVKAHTMHCHDTASVSFFVPPKACCDVPSKIFEGERELSAPSCCLVISEDLVFEYENTVPDIQGINLSFDFVIFISSYIRPQEIFNSSIELEDQNLPPPIASSTHRSFLQVYII